MLVIGRITKDAVVKQLKDERQVIEFSIAVNDWYKPKGSQTGVKVSTFFNCSYWLNPRIAERLKKGTLVELSGRAGVNVYNDMKGEAKGSLIFHVNNIQIHQMIKAGSTSALPVAESISEPVDDLPF